MIQTNDLIPLYLIKQVLVLFVGFFSFSTIALLVVLIFHKLNTESRERQRTRLREQYLELLGRYLADEEVEIRRPQGELECESISEALVEIMAGAPREDIESLKELIRSLGLPTHFQRLAISRQWLKRYHAVEKLGFFQLEELTDYYLGLLAREKREDVAAKLLWALSNLGDCSVLATITTRLATETSKSSKFNEYIYANLIQALRRNELVNEFLDYFRGVKDDPEIPLVLKRDLIAACGTARLQEAIELVIDFYHQEQESLEIKIACLRVFEKMGTFEAEMLSPEPAAAGATLRMPVFSEDALPDGAQEIIMSCLQSEDWRLRAVSANAAHLCDQGLVLNMLRDALYDRNYFVRINASRALARFGKDGFSVLKSEIDSEDRMVKDTVRFMLEEKVHV